MQRERGGLVPIGEVVSGLDDAPVPAIRDASPQARRGFTLADQVHQLVSASEADPERGFMARTMALCSLPRTNPGNRLQYKRQNGPFTLYMVAGGGNKLPFGNFPRLLLAWVPTENLLGLDRLDVNERFAQRNGGGVPCFVSRPVRSGKGRAGPKSPSASGISTKRRPTAGGWRSGSGRWPFRSRAETTGSSWPLAGPSFLQHPPPKKSPKGP